MKKLLCTLALLICASAYGEPSGNATNILGFTIGQTFNLPECQWKGDGALATYDYGFQQPTTPCWEHSILTAHPGDPLDSAGSFEIGVVPAGDKAPDGVRSDELQLIVVAGRIQGMLVPTTGYKEQDRILDLLIKKYGKPTLNKRAEVENHYGAKFAKYTVTWKTSDAAITYDSMGSTIDWGLIQVVSPSGQQFLKKKQAESEKSESSF